MKSKKVKIPDFIVIGAMRAGTTTLQELMSDIKQISLARMKETDFFIKEKNFDRGFDWYASQFDLKRNLCGEISPNYTKCDVFENVPERVYEANPDAKLIYIVRDPVERAISHYQFSYLFGQKMPPPEKFLRSHDGQHIIDTSRYAYQIKPWIELFGKRAILFIDFNALIEAPQNQFDRMAAFLGLEDAGAIQLSDKHNSAQNLSATPLWYLRLRQTAFATSLRALLPRKAAKFIKSIIAGKNKTLYVPQIPESVIQDMRKTLKSDAKEFRKISGMKFEHWQV